MTNNRNNRLAEILHCFELDGKAFVCAPRLCLEIVAEDRDVAMQRMTADLIGRSIDKRLLRGRPASGRTWHKLHLSSTAKRVLNKIATHENMSESAIVETLILQYFSEQCAPENLSEAV